MCLAAGSPHSRFCMTWWHLSSAGRQISEIDWIGQFIFLWAINSFSWDVKQTSLGHISTSSLSTLTIKNVGFCVVEVNILISLCSSKKWELTAYTCIKETSWWRLQLIFEARNVFTRSVLFSETGNLGICCLLQEKKTNSWEKPMQLVV